MQNKKKKKKINAYNLVLVIITLVFLVFMLSGLTYSRLNSHKPKGKQVDAIVFNIGDLAINYLDGNKIDLDYPTNKKYEYSFSVTNTSSSRIYYTIYLKDTEVIKNNIKVKLLNSKKEEVNNIKLVNGENLLQSVLLIEPNVTARYTLVLENKKNRTSIKGKITVENESINKNTLADLVLNDNVFNISPKTTIGEVALEDEGLNKSYDDYGITYYFRGDVKNNYVKINNKMYRIIRINGDGTVRAILDENDINEVPFNINEDENKSNLVLLEKSSIINNLNNWMKENIAEYEDLLVASSFCSDSGFDTIRNGVRYPTTHERMNINAITYRCFSTSYLSKVGLISPEEIIFAGGSRDGENTKFYLYNSSITNNTWTTGSHSIENESVVRMFALTGNGSLASNIINENIHIRPVINISSSAVAKGEGTKENPYILVK